MPRLPSDLTERGLPSPDPTASSQRNYSRPPHEQTRELGDGFDHETFTHAQFIAFLDNSSMKFLRSGTFVITLFINADQVDNALPMRHLVTQGMPLSIDIQPVRQAIEMMDD